ncbi:prepilin-type N-terminal cleavage/methylation domain-containing protein [Kushneria sinocarnis]|uniref:Type II secretion system protein H n=1 Tax=Kushneria sinocarnis TaxID=595502 RepID=A0A420WT19_9GAMM|nr:GspH/FimT family pseudopilin [Kushneria sinocarnis]RKQ95839.1 prepilin-type N-terminal cleavage/methylation domain-containing protein [Kushneria sinocarnis]
MIGSSLVRHQGGFTLLETVIALALLGMLLGIGIPQLSRQLQARALRLDARALAALIHQARSASLGASRALQLCGSRDGLQCNDDWHQVILRPAGGRPIHHLRLAAPERIIWRGASTPLVFHPRWQHNFLNGTFSLCPAQHTELAAWRIIVSRLGRPRLERKPDDPRCRTAS